MAYQKIRCEHQKIDCRLYEVTLTVLMTDHINPSETIFPGSKGTDSNLHTGLRHTHNQHGSDP